MFVLVLLHYTAQSHCSYTHSYRCLCHGTLRKNLQLADQLDAVQHSNRVLDRTKGDMDIDSHHDGDSMGGGFGDGDGDQVGGRKAGNDSSGHQLLSEINSTLRANSEITRQ